ncbi:MAG: arsenical pump-driving ATpase [Herbinix sp.]|jgi:arsenite-transporting ATPase|nr:arsenical pump-driving ATpase [Herbinix sp.]
MGRIIIFTGKGGVGKTSVAAAHARKAALQGKKTLIVSADMAHNLGDLFELPIGREITCIDGNLYGLEIDPEYEMEHNFSNLVRAIDKMLKGVDAKQEELEDLSMLPGIEELFSLLRIQQIYDSQEFEVIIVDCAPTGETLSLLKFPELFSWYMEKLFPIGKFAMRLLHPVSQKLFKVELPDGKAMNDIELLYSKLVMLQELLKNRDISSIRLVAMPEKMVVEETKRNYMYLNLFNFNVDAIFINRILPNDINLKFFDEWLMLQAEYIKELEQIFGTIPIYKVKWYDIEITGIKALDRLVEDVITDAHILDVQTKVRNEEYEKTESGYQLKVYLPCVTKEEVMMHETGTDIILRIGNFKRSIPLPNALRKYHVEGAKIIDQFLRIQFVPVEGGQSDE